MSQTWDSSPLLGSGEKINATYTDINNAFLALRSSFSGTSAPTSPSPLEGQVFAKTDTSDFKMYDGAGWKKIFEYDKTYGGLLPLTAGASYPLSGNLDCGSNRITNVSDPQSAQDATTKNYADNNYYPQNSDIAMGSYDITMDHNPTNSNELARKAYVDTKISKSGGVLTGNLDANSKKISNLADPGTGGDAVNQSTLSDRFDISIGHDHNGVNSKKLVAENVNVGTTGLDVNDSFFLIDKKTETGSGHVGSGAWTTIVTFTVTVPTGVTNLLLVGDAKTERGSTNSQTSISIDGTAEADTIGHNRGSSCVFIEIGISSGSHTFRLQYCNGTYGATGNPFLAIYGLMG